MIFPPARNFVTRVITSHGVLLRKYVSARIQTLERRVEVEFQGRSTAKDHGQRGGLGNPLTLMAAA